MQQDNSSEESIPITQTQSVHDDSETRPYIDTLKQFWHRQIHPTRGDKRVIIFMCIPLGIWIFSILAIFESSPPGTFGWFWLYWIAFASIIMVYVIGLIWRIYDIIKNKKRKKLLHDRRD